jgi:CDP-diacylglycerol--glycerol-3-phosphate 3-phosphatidyltransferase
LIFRGERMNIPNKITLTRIITLVAMLIALFILDIVYWLNPQTLTFSLLGNSGIHPIYLGICVVFVLAALTDKLDGSLARKWNQVTDLGKFLDPVADKLLVDGLLIYLCLPHFGYSPTNFIFLWCVIVMIIRDIVVDALRSIAAAKGEVLAANVFGKMKTVLQMIAIPLVLLGGWPFTYFDAGWGYGRIAEIFVYLATLASLFSGIFYLVQNHKVFAEGKHD